MRTAQHRAAFIDFPTFDVANDGLSITLELVNEYRD